MGKSLCPLFFWSSESLFLEITSPYTLYLEVLHSEISYASRCTGNDSREKWTLPIGLDGAEGLWCLKVLRGLSSSSFETAGPPLSRACDILCFCLTQTRASSKSKLATKSYLGYRGKSIQFGAWRQIFKSLISFSTLMIISVRNVFSLGTNMLLKVAKQIRGCFTQVKGSSEAGNFWLVQRLSSVRAVDWHWRCPWSFPPGCKMAAATPNIKTAIRGGRPGCCTEQIVFSCTPFSIRA